MKYLYLLLLPLLLASCYHVKPVIEKKNYPDPFQFELIHKVDGSRDEIYVRLREWVSRMYKSSNGVLDMDYPAGGKLIIKGIFPLSKYMGTSGYIHHGEMVEYTMVITIKDGRYRVVISDFKHRDGVYAGLTEVHATKGYGRLDDAIRYYVTNTLKRKEDHGYYLVKNAVMEESEALLELLRIYMLLPEKEW